MACRWGVSARFIQIYVGAADTPRATYPHDKQVLRPCIPRIWSMSLEVEQLLLDGRRILSMQEIFNDVEWWEEWRLGSEFDVELLGL